MTLSAFVKFTIITFFYIGLKAEIDLPCSEAEREILDYECTDNKPIGAGVNSVTYRVKLKNDDVEKALKISLVDTTDKNQCPELTYLQKLQGSKYVVKLIESFDIKKIDGKNYLFEVLELAENGDFESFLKNKSEFFKDDDKNLFEFSMMLAEGLKEIHSKDIVHASVKPQNIIITKDFTPKYIDFDSSVEMGTEALSRGDHLFNAPEVSLHRGEKLIWGAPQDIFSLGATFYYMAHQKVPFDGINRYFHKRAVQRRKYIIQKGINRDYINIIQRCMQWKYDERASLETILKLIDEAKHKPADKIKRLDKDMVASLDNLILEEPGWIMMDPLLLLIIIGIVVSVLSIVGIAIGCLLRRKKQVNGAEVELYAENNS